MIKFKNKKYQLLFSNNLSPLLALNFADEMFFEEFEKLCGGRYRILSIMQNGIQEKYGLISDLKILRSTFLKKINDRKWPQQLLKSFDSDSNKLKKLLEKISNIDFQIFNNKELVKYLTQIRKSSARLDASSNMLYLFSVLLGEKFSTNLKKYTEDINEYNQNLIYYTQPIKNAHFAKIIIPSLPDKIILNDFDNNFSKILRTGSYIKDEVSFLLNLREKKMNLLLSVIAKRLKCLKNDINFLQLGEISEFLKLRNSTKQLISDRKQLTVFYYKQSKLFITEGLQAKMFLITGKLENVNLTYSKTNVLKGQTACPGTFKGIVKIATNYSQAVEKITKGDILVAQYTSVEYLPAMRKAGAILTQTGGITSHAAIVSRELKKPCIIGIDQVTTILKDGDLVEVDANIGIVKILK